MGWCIYPCWTDPPPNSASRRKPDFFWWWPYQYSGISDKQHFKKIGEGIPGLTVYIGKVMKTRLNVIECAKELSSSDLFVNKVAFEGSIDQMGHQYNFLVQL